MPRLDQTTKDRILELCFPTDGRQPLNAAQAWRQLQMDNQAADADVYVVTSSERPIQYFVKQISEQETETMQLDRLPWSLVLNEKADIPFDPILLQLLRLWFDRQLEHGEGPPFVAFPVGIARWAVRLHKVAPFLSEKELLYRARRYFAMEHMAELSRAQPDSSFEDLEIAMMDERDERRKARYEDFRGRPIKLGEEVQTEAGKPPQIKISVSAAEAERILSKRKRSRGNKK